MWVYMNSTACTDKAHDFVNQLLKTNLRFSQQCLWRVWSSELQWRGVWKHSSVLGKHTTSIFRSKNITIIKSASANMLLTSSLTVKMGGGTLSKLYVASTHRTAPFKLCEQLKRWLLVFPSHTQKLKYTHLYIKLQFGSVWVWSLVFHIKGRESDKCSTKGRWEEYLIWRRSKSRKLHNEICNFFIYWHNQINNM
jgi:hypothetical protein